MWYDVECYDPIVGKSVKIATTEFTYLHIAEVEVYGVFESASTLGNYEKQQGKCRLVGSGEMGKSFYLDNKGNWSGDYSWNP